LRNRGDYDRKVAAPVTARETLGELPAAKVQPKLRSPMFEKTRIVSTISIAIRLWFFRLLFDSDFVSS